MSTWKILVTAQPSRIASELLGRARDLHSEKVDPDSAGE
jgi:hypothetical protein